MQKTSRPCRCPSCSGNMEFVIKQRKLRCASCHTTMSVEEYETKTAGGKDIDIAAKGSEISADCAETGYGTGQTQPVTGSRSCPSCGRALLPDPRQAGQKCPFCGSFIVSSEQCHAQRTPEFIGVFVQDRDDFLKIWRSEINWRRPFVPDKFVAGAAIRKITPAYVPFWFYDVIAEGQVEYTVETVRMRRCPSGCRRIERSRASPRAE